MPQSRSGRRRSRLPPRARRELVRRTPGTRRGSPAPQASHARETTSSSVGLGPGLGPRPASVAPCARAARCRTSCQQCAVMPPSSLRRPRARAPAPRASGSAPWSSFSGCRRTWSLSRKKRLTVASSPSSATTMSPSARCPAGARPPGRPRRMPALIIESPRTREDVLALVAADPRVAPARSPRCSPRRGSACRRPRCRPAGARRRPDDRLDRVDRPVEHLDRARLRRIAPQQPDLLEVGQMRVHRRGRREPDRLADVAHRRRIAVLRGVLLDEVEDLLLALRQVLPDVHTGSDSSSRGGRSEHLFDTVARAQDGRQTSGHPPRAILAAHPRRWRNW